MQIQVVREDREALKDQSNRELLEYLEYQKELSKLSNQYNQIINQIERETDHDILDIKIEDIRRTREAKDQMYIEALNVRTEEEYLFDETYKKHVRQEGKTQEMHRTTDQMQNQQEQRDKQLLDFMNDHCDQQVERQFKRSREMNHQITETMKE